MNISRKTAALISCDAPKKIIAELEAEGFLPILTERHPALPLPVASHTDMLFFVFEDKIFTPRDYISMHPKIKKALTEQGYKTVECGVSLLGDYPNDISFNIAVMKDTLVGRTDCFPKEISELTAKKGLNTVFVKQGYAKCSTVVLGNKGIITADTGIAKAAEGLSLSVLKTENSNAVFIDGYDYGFLGGVCGVCGKTVYFSGNIHLHPQGERISAFCQNLGFSVVCLSQERLCDIGGIFFLPFISPLLQS